MNSHLEVSSGPLRGQKLPLSRAQSVGRATDCDVVVGGYSRVSRSHARLDWNGSAYVLSDSNSTNGTLVNGRKISVATLRDGDQIQLGDFSATLRTTANANGSSTAPVQSPPKTSLSQRWRALPLSAPQRWGLVATVFIVLGLGLRGWQTSAAPPPRVDEIPNAPSNQTGDVPKIPDAPPVADAAQTQIAPAVEPVNGKLAPAALNSVKAATVLIAHRENNGYAMGSGFALGDARRIITNRHVVVDEGGNVRDSLLIFEAGTPRERKVSVPAAQIQVAPQTAGGQHFEDDLAVITLNDGQTPALSPGQSEALSETDEVYAVGFPLGVETLTLNGDLPSVSVKATRVERLQSDKGGAVSVIQLGGSVTHGNSGGPVVNNRGEVVGVISSGVEGTGMAYAIPMRFVQALPGV